MDGYPDTWVGSAATGNNPFKSLGNGLAASPGVAIGKIVFDSATAEAFAKAGEDCILCRNETSADDIAGLKVSE